MAQNEYTTNRKYRHLTREKRAQIEVLLQLKLPKSRIAREVGIARSTLYNELARGTVQQPGRKIHPLRSYGHRRDSCHPRLHRFRAK